MMIEYTVKVYDDREEWYLNGQLHRKDGPAIKYSNGEEEWCLNGQRHREDGPAIKYSNGEEKWYLNGKLHREDGPAIKYSNGKEEWYLNGFSFSKENFYNRKIINTSEINISNNKSLICKSCKEIYPYAEPNQTDGSLICYSCKL